jgi:hypothetical protein
MNTLLSIWNNLSRGDAGQRSKCTRLALLTYAICNQVACFFNKFAFNNKSLGKQEENQWPLRKTIDLSIIW